MTKPTASKPVAVVDTFALSRGYGTKSHAKRAMVVFAGTHLLSPEEFTLTKVDKLHHFIRLTTIKKPTVAVESLQPDPSKIKAAIDQDAQAERGITSPAPKKCDALNAAAIAATPVDANGVPLCLKISQPERKAAWDLKPPRPAIVAKREPTPQEAEMLKQVTATKTTKKAPKPKKVSTRFDWAAAEAKAKEGKLPTAPDMSAPTHKYYRGKLADLTKLARASDIKGLQKYDLGEREDGSPALLKKYRALAVIAMKAGAK